MAAVEDELLGPGEMDVELVSIGSLVLSPFDRNPRIHDIPAIAASLSEHGQHRPAVVTRADRQVRIGNGMVEAAVSIGWETINVAWVDDDELQAVRRAIADNVAPTGKYDEPLLRSLLEEVGTDIPGLDPKILADMMDEALAATAENTRPDYPIVARPGEHYSYVLIVSQNQIDEAWLETTFGLERKRDYKAHDRVGVSRACTIGDFRENVLPALAEAAGWTPPEAEPDPEPAAKDG